MSYDEDVVETFEESDELTLLKERADLMGIKYHPSIGVDKLREKVTLFWFPKMTQSPSRKQQPRSGCMELKMQTSYPGSGLQAWIQTKKDGRVTTLRL